MIKPHNLIVSCKDTTTDNATDAATDAATDNDSPKFLISHAYTADATVKEILQQLRNDSQKSKHISLANCCK